MANTENTKETNRLDDERRVRVLSPGMLVFKRFTRNRLAVLGTIIIVLMFIFSFIGGAISPYEENQVFRTTTMESKAYAGVRENTDFLYTDAPGKELPKLAKTQAILAINNGEESFVSQDVTYNLIKESDEFYRVVEMSPVATVTTLGNVASFSSVDGAEISDAVKEAFSQAQKDGETSFKVEGTDYYISGSGRNVTIAVTQDLCMINKLIFSPYSAETTLDYNFQVAAERAMEHGKTEFTVDGVDYKADIDEKTSSAIFYKVEGGQETEYAMASHFTVNPVSSDVFLSIEFKDRVQEAVKNNESSFVFADANGTEAEYTVERNNNEYMIKTMKEIQVNSNYESPSAAHWLGTDGNGMDILTRLMYGGRISLLIGFLVVILSALIGVVLGGLAGYFGKWLDNLIMRLVDVFNCIPAMPVYLILGSIMDFAKIDPRLRIWLLMVILSVLSWPSIARLTRGQILSLREQEFMVATEATGIRVSKRIFKHLIPNVMPQLIVSCTMSLGSVILMEATLSFLGLGVKFPYASWGNMITAVNDLYVLKTYWFVWIPAGICIVLTVLGFNFIGDGLRDAYDPKMKR